MANITTTDHHIARLMSDLKQIDNSIDRLNNSTIFNKAEVAELTINQTRILLSHMVLTILSIKNDLHRLNGQEL